MTTDVSSAPRPVARSVAADRPPRPGAMRASAAYAWRILLRIKHVPEQMADAVLIPVLFTVLFTHLFGGALAGSTGDYLQFLLPGTLVMSVLLVTVYSGATLNSDRSSGVLDRFRSLPVWQPAAIVGGLLGDVGRYVISSSLVVALGVAMGFRPDGGVAGTAAAMGIVIVFAFSLSWVWTTLGLLLRTQTSVLMASFVVQFPLTFASNAFVDPATMPGWLRAFVDANPVSHLVTTVRDLIHGTAAASQVGWSLVICAAIVAVFGPLTLHLYRTRG